MDDPNSMHRSSSGGGSHNASATMRQYLGAKVNENNIVKYLGVIETKMTKVLNQYKEQLMSQGVDMKAYGANMIGPSRPHGDIPDMMFIDAPKMNITNLVHGRSKEKKDHDEKIHQSGVMKHHDPVSPMSRDAIQKEVVEAELMKQAQKDNKKREGKKEGKRRGGLGGLNKLKMAAKGVKEDKVIEYL